MNNLRVEWLNDGTIINYNGVLLSRAEADRRRDALEGLETAKKKELNDATAGMDKAHLEWALQEIAKQIGSRQRVSELVAGDNAANDESDVEVGAP